MTNMNPMAMLQQMRQPHMGMRQHPHQQMHGNVEGFFEEMAYGKKQIPDTVKAVVLAVVKEQADDVMAQHGYTTHEDEGYDKSRHRKFKETMEKMRDMSPAEVSRAIDEHFSNVTPQQRKVLQVLSQECSKKKMAEKAGIDKEDFMKIKHELEHQLK